MAYKFIKYRTEYPNPEMSFTSGWVFEPQSIFDVYDYFEKFTLPALRCGMEEVFSNFSRWLHQNRENPNFDVADLDEYMISHEDSFTAVAWSTCRLNGGIPAFAGHNMAIELFKNRCQYFREGCKVFYGKDGLRNIAMDSRYSTIVDECYMDDLQFPDFIRPTLADVKYTMWNGGQHWYAKVEKLDVVVDGVQKWNSKGEAVEAARKFIDETWPVK